MSRLVVGALLLLVVGCAVPLRADPFRREPPAPIDYWDVDWWTRLVPYRMWQYAPREMGSPAFDPDTERVYAATRDGTIQAINQGKVEWEYETSAQYNAGPTLADGVVYAASAQGVLYALHSRSGGLIWKYEAGEELGSPPVIEQDLVLVASMSDTLFAVDRRTGEWKWRYRRETPAGFTVRGASAPVVSNGRVYAGFSDGFVVALDIADGTLEWERQLGAAGELVDVDTTPIVDEASGDLFVASYKNGLFALDAATGAVRWNTAVEKVTNLAYDGHRLYASGDQLVAAFDPRGGVRQWSAPIGNRNGRKPVLAGPHLVVPVDTALLFLDPATGRSRVAWDPGDGVSATPVAVGSHLYILSNLGFLYAMYVHPRPA